LLDILEQKEKLRLRRFQEMMEMLSSLRYSQELTAMTPVNLGVFDARIAVKEVKPQVIYFTSQNMAPS
jgi:hypothetical protein